jgi:hypothetical protein
MQGQDNDQTVSTDGSLLIRQLNDSISVTSGSLDSETSRDMMKQLGMLQLSPMKYWPYPCPET